MTWGLTHHTCFQECVAHVFFVGDILVSVYLEQSYVSYHYAMYGNRFPSLWVSVAFTLGQNDSPTWILLG